MEIRAARPADAAALLEIYAPLVRETTISFEDVPPSVDEMARRIEGTLPRFPWLAMEDASGVLGYAYAARHRERAAYRWSVEVSAYVRSTARRRGVGRALVEVVDAQRPTVTVGDLGVVRLEREVRLIGEFG